MNKIDILEVLDKYSANREDFIVISGAALVLLGIKEKTGDIDIATSEEFYLKLLKEHECTFERCNEYGCNIYFVDRVINFGTTYFDSEYVIADGYKVQSAESIKKLKQFLNREKDKLDIELIDKYRRNNNG